MRLFDSIRKLLNPRSGGRVGPSDRLDPAMLVQFQTAANNHARRFVGQECVFKEKYLVCLAVLTDLKVDESGYRARLTRLEENGFHSLPKECIEVGSTWRKGQGGLIQGSIIFGGAYASFQIYSDPAVVLEAKRLAANLPDANPKTRFDALRKHLDNAAGWSEPDDHDADT